MTAPFDSAWLKWGRAVVHAQSLEREIEAASVRAGSQPPSAVRPVYEPRRHGFSMRVETIDPIPAHWRLILGDVANDLRSSLDHLAWSMVQRGRTPVLTEAKERQVGFPITSSRDKFNQDLPRRLPGARRADLAIVRHYQPWRGGQTRRRWHCLTLLQELVNSDKHREMQGLWMVPRIADLEVLEAIDCEHRSDGRGRRVFMESGTEIGFLKARKTGPNPALRVSFALTLYPSFEKQLPVQQWLDVTTILVAQLLSHFQESPDEVNDLGIDPVGLEAARSAWASDAGLWAAARGRGVPMRP